MKQILLRALAITACVAFSFAGAQAQVITAERAQEIANNFFQNGKQKSAAVRSTAAVSMKKSADSRILSSESSSDAPTFHILTPASGEGFVIVAGEEMENPIIGYSFDSKLPTDDELPENFIGYLADIDAQVKALRKYNANNPQKAAAARSAMQKTNYAATTMGNIVRNLETAPWGQGAPFNKLCYTDASKNTQAKTGCGPTAFAILCHYHKWPKTGTGSVTHNGETLDLSSHNYDYENMLDSYSSTYTEAQATAVATLMRDLGYAFKVTYGSTSTGFSENATYLKSNFSYRSKYNETIQSGFDCLWRDNTNYEQLVAYIKDCLNQGYPIPYSSTGDSGRHIFILDGYTDNGYYHFNWGWSGQGNGWFTLDAMTPDTESDYSSSHRAYLYLIPNKTEYTITATANSESMGAVSINGGTASGTATASLIEGATATLTAHPADGYALANWTKDGVVISAKNTIEVKVGTSDNEYVANFDDEANVYVVKDYIISPSTVGLTGTSKTNVVNYQTSDEYPATLSLASTTTNGTSLSAMSRISDDQIRLYAFDQATSNTTIKYTLSVHDDYIITEYHFEYSLNNISYPCSISYNGGTITSPSDVEWHPSPVIANNAKTAEFTITAEKTNSASNFYIKNFTVTIAKEGANTEGGESTTTYTITATADPTTAGSVTGGGTYNEGETVTLTATANSGYEFVNWTNNINADVVTENPYTVTATADVTYTANFQEAATTTYTITATADPATAGSVTGGGTYDEGATVTLTATPNSGYTFKNWTSGTTIVSTNSTYSFTANATAYTDLVANFEEETTTTTDLSGRYFRLKTLRSNEYMNILDYEDHNGAFGGVNVTALDVNNNDQIFYFTKSGESYKLKSLTDHYLYNDFSNPGYWNVNANSTSDSECMLLTFEPTTEELQYLISCEKGYFMSGPSSQGGNGSNYVYCDTPEKENADTWLLEEVKYTITATANPADGGTANVNGENSVEVTYNGSATLTATANDGYNFVNWTKGTDIVSTEATVVIENITANAEYVANFERITYTVNVNANPGTAGTATVATGTDPGSSSIEVEPETSVTLTATPAEGYLFANWTNNLNTDVVTDNPYTPTVTADVTYTANFEKKYINVTLTDKTNSNNQNPFVFNFVLNDLEGEVTKATIATKLMEKYPVIMSLGAAENATLTDNGTSYTYTNTVNLPFEIGNGKEDDAVIWYNIYYSNIENRPNYLSASSNETTLVEKINDETYPYGDNPVYNTEKGNDPISWAIYSVNNSLEFMLKNKVTGKFIQVTSVADNDAQNAVYVDEAYATAFHFIRKTEDFINYFAFAAKIGENTGYLCSTSSDYGWATHYNSYDQAGGWARIEDPGYFSRYVDLNYGLFKWFAPGNGYSIVTTEIQDIKDALENYENITLNTFVKYGIILADSENWPTIKLNIAPENSGTTSINGEEGVTTKRAPVGYQFPIAATPAAGYHFVNWTKGTDEPITSAEHTIAISGAKGEVTELTANFAINIYTVNVTAEANGTASSNVATVEHGNSVTLTATPENGYEFTGWYNGEELISTENPYTFTATSDINYTARFNEAAAGAEKCVIHIVAVSTDGTEVTNSEDGNVKAIFNNLGLDWPTSAEFAVGADVHMVATEDYEQKAYLFDGWYKNGELVSKELEVTVQATENATYEARFFRGCVVIGKSNNNQWGYIGQITYEDGTQIGLYAATNRVVVAEGTIVKINTVTVDGYRLGNWTDEESNEVGRENHLVVKATEDVTYTANFESAFYYLTVRANDDAYGSAEAESGTSLATTVKVGLNMTATLRATNNDGYKFVNWTKGGNVVSTDAEYIVPAIGNAANMADVEYVANFIEVEAAEAGVYYRIAYDFPVEDAVATAGAARAAGVGGEQACVVSYETGGNALSSYEPSWEYNGGIPLTINAKNSNGVQADKINIISTGQLSLLACSGNSNNPLYMIYTISVSGDYKITGYYVKGKAYNSDLTIIHNGNTEKVNKDADIEFSDSGLETDNLIIELKTDVYNNNAALDISTEENSFVVYVKKIERETARYYMQSEACGVSNKTNALLMTQDTGASSIFYYADSKLLSYKKGTYIKEDSSTRGLQGIGDEGGNVTINTAGETSTIAAPSYLHANTNVGTSTSYFIDHCGSNTGTAAHANHNFVIEEVESLPVTISAAEHATLYAPVALKIPDGVKAYILKEQNFTAGTYATMTSLKNGIIPPNTGVILKGAPNNYDFVILDNDDTDVDIARVEAIDNVLEGTVAATHVTKDAYILASRNGKVGLYPLAGNSYLTGGTTPTFTNNSHKAYLPVEGNFGEILKNSNGFHFVFDDDIVTDIDGVEAEETGTIYDLQGRKLSEITEPGIYIVNGKKIFVK